MKLYTVKDIEKKYINKTFGRLTIKSIFDINNLKSYKLKFNCICSCGNAKVISMRCLYSGVKSCGCLMREKASSCNSRNVLNKKFGLLTVIEKECVKKSGTVWKCRCDCGNIRSVHILRLNNDKTKNITTHCGCLYKKKKTRRFTKKEDIEWRNLVYKKDKYKCVLTSATNDLEAHHLNSYLLFPNERLDVNNGVTLNRKIHNYFHLLYGKEATKENFQEFSKKFTGNGFVNFIEESNYNLLINRNKLIKFIQNIDICNKDCFLACGNGGSLTLADHFCEELVGKYDQIRPPIKALPLTNSSIISCIANDFGFDYIFSRQIEAFNCDYSTLICFTTSGNSENIVKAIEIAIQSNMKIILFNGFPGGKCHELVKNYNNGYELLLRYTHKRFAQELQKVAIHALIEKIERIFFNIKKDTNLLNSIENS